MILSGVLKSYLLLQLLKNFLLGLVGANQREPWPECGAEEREQGFGSTRKQGLTLAQLLGMSEV